MQWTVSVLQVIAGLHSPSSQFALFIVEKCPTFGFCFGWWRNRLSHSPYWSKDKFSIHSFTRKLNDGSFINSLSMDARFPPSTLSTDCLPQLLSFRNLADRSNTVINFYVAIQTGQPCIYRQARNWLDWIATKRLLISPTKHSWLSLNCTSRFLRFPWATLLPVVSFLSVIVLQVLQGNFCEFWTSRDWRSEFEFNRKSSARTVCVCLSVCCVSRAKFAKTRDNIWQRMKFEIESRTAFCSAYCCEQLLRLRREQQRVTSARMGKIKLIWPGCLRKLLGCDFGWEKKRRPSEAERRNWIARR